jgi:transcription antitermination factor NusG
MLANKGFEHFLPVYHCSRKWSDRIKKVERPLFPGYVFCRLNTSERILPVLTIPGVLHLVGAGKIPVPVPDAEIQAIRTLLQTDLSAAPWPDIPAGIRVQIERGPLAGLEGVVVEAEGSHRLLLSVSLLQRSVSVRIERSWARPVS